MVFNPVYIQKPSEGESQLFGSGIANQKTTYLFSDIIKVILSKSEPSGINVQTEKNELVASNAGNLDSLIISDAEVELYEKLMKINLTSMDTNEMQKLVSEDPSVLLESLQMYLTGLTNQNEATPIIDKGFEIDDNDLVVVLNILAGNAVKDNIDIESNTGISKELSEFVAEINGILNSLEKKEEQCLLIQQDDISIELHPLQNGKILVKVSEELKPEPIVKNSNPDLMLETTNAPIGENTKVAFEKIDTPVSEKQITIPGDIQKAQTNPVKTESTVIAVPEFKVEEKQKSVETGKIEKKPAEEKIVKQTAAISEALKNNATKSETVDSSSGNSKKIKNGSSSVNDNTEKKIVFQNKGADNAPVVEKFTLAADKAEKNPESKEYFDGKIKVEVVTVKNDSAKTSKGHDATDAVKEVKLPVENNSAKVNPTENNNSIKNVKVAEILPENNKIKNSDKNKVHNVTDKIFAENADVEKSKISLNSTSSSVKEVVSEKTTQTPNANELRIDKEDEFKPAKQAGGKHEKLEIQKQTSELQNSSQKITAASSDIITERQDQAINASVIDKKNQTEKDNSSKSELSGVLSAKEKTAKSVAPNNEADKQKPDSQQQNNFEKIFSNINKTEHIGKEIKESVKLVEQSRLMNEIENIIKSGERKAVTINLYPEELGSVKVSLDITDKSVAAKINVASDSIRQMILTQADSLKTSLSQSGIQLASLNVSVNNSEDKSTPQGKMKRKDGGTDKKLVISDLPNPVKVKNLGYNTYDYIA